MNEKKKILAGIALVGAFSFANASQAVVIEDGYNGRDTLGFDRSGYDIIGSHDIYDITSMNVTFSGSLMTVLINTFYDEDTDGNDNIDYGDLFISTNGWNPNGTAANRYATDEFGIGDGTTGEVWEYAFDTDAGVLREISAPSDVELVDANERSWRNGQEILVSGNARALQTRSSFDDSKAGKSLTYVIDFASIWADEGTGQKEFDPDYEIGLRWQMTCANDVIEGSASVPEPASLALLGLGLFGLGFARRKSK